MSKLLYFFVLFLALSAQGVMVPVFTPNDLVNAVNANNAKASGGDVINVNAGTYNLSGSLHAGGDPAIGIDIIKPVTIQAIAGANPLINFSGGYIVLRIQNSNVTVDGLTFAGAQFGVQIQDVSNFNGYVVSNIVLRRLSVSTTGMGGQAISTGGMSDSIIELCTVTSTYNAAIVLDRGPAPANSGSNRNLVINNTITSTTTGSGIVIQLSDYNTVAGNTITDTAFDGVFVTGGQHNYIGQNVITRPHNGITLTEQNPPGGRQSLRNYVGNNSLSLNAKPGSDALWFNYDSNYNMGFLNDGFGAEEAGMALFNSAGNYVRANNLHNNPNGGIVVRRDPASGNTTPNRNSIQQNYFHDHPANGGITTSTDTLNDYGFNYISGDPAQIGSAIGGIVTDNTVNSVFYANVIRDLRQAEQLQNNTSGAVFYLNRHVNTVNHLLDTSSSAQFDSGSTTLGGNYYSDFTSANGNPSNGSTPYTNIRYLNLSTAPYPDHYPYASESLGKIYSIGLRLPSAGSTLTAGSFKTVAWASQGCVLVDLLLLNGNGSLNSTIASNTADYGYYRWQVPAITSGSYLIRADCKTSSGAATGKLSYGSTFNIAPAGLTLLSPQANLVIDSGLKMQISWSKSSGVSAVDVYIRYADSQIFSLVQAGVTADYVTINAPTVTTNRVAVKLVSGGFGDSTDGWFTIRGSSAGAVTAPSSADNLYIGTPFLVEWVAPQNTEYVNIDLVGSGTRNIITQLGDFSNYLMLVPDLPGGAAVRLTFYNSAGTVLQQISSPTQAVVNSSQQPNAIAAIAGGGQSAPVNSTFGTALQVQVTNSIGAGIAGVAVTFSAPSSGAGGTFGGATTVLTNGSGIATAPSFTANGTVGSFTVTATAGGLATAFGLTNTAGSVPTQTNVGYYNNGSFVLDANGNGQYDGPPGDKNFFYVAKQAGDIAVFGDWNGDGHTKVGIYRNGFWILDYNGNGVYDNDGTAANDKFFAFGGAGSTYIPVVGDWNGNGKSKIGYYQNGFWVLDYNGNGSYDGVAVNQDKVYGFGGNANEVPLLGDWNHDGRTKIGIFYSGNFVLDYDGDGSYTGADKFYPFVSFMAGDKAIFGDWTGNGFTKIGIYRNGFWILDYNGNGTYDGTGAGQDKFYAFGGNTGEIRLVGDWNGSGTSKIGVYVNGFWILDYNGNGSYDGTGAGQDRFIPFGGNAGEQPIIGKW